MKILTLNSVSKYYENKKALDSVSLSVPKGSVYGLLGPNGAGKTTLLRIITGIFHQDHGQVLFYEKPVKKIHPQKLGYIPEERGLYKKMKLRDQLLFFAALKNIPKSQAKSLVTFWLEKFALSEWEGSELRQLSKGMQQKVQLISALIHQPELVILDEPFSGFDPVNADLAKNIILDLNNKGTTFILSTHHMESVESLCSHIALLNKGKVVLKGTVNDIKKSFSEKIFRVEGQGNLLNNGNSYIVNSISESENGLQATVTLKEGFSNNDLLNEILKTGLEVSTFSEKTSSIEEIFLKTIREGE